MIGPSRSMTRLEGKPKRTIKIGLGLIYSFNRSGDCFPFFHSFARLRESKEIPIVDSRVESNQMKTRRPWGLAAGCGNHSGEVTHQLEGFIKHMSAIELVLLMDAVLQVLLLHRRITPGVEAGPADLLTMVVHTVRVVDDVILDRLLAGLREEGVELAVIDELTHRIP